MLTAGFAAALLDPALPVPPGLTDPMGRPAGRRFAVYRNNVAVSLTEALEQGFPVVRKLVGVEFFAAMAGVYLRAHPPQSRILATYGQDMPAFLQGFPPVAALPYLADVARLELALRAAYHAADVSGMDPVALGALPPARLMAARVRLAPAVALIRSAWPVHGIWMANMEDAPPPAMTPQDVLVTRPGLDPAPHLLPTGGGDFVAALMAGAPLGQAALAAGEGHDLSATVALLLAGGALTDLTETPE
jgi:hypothetical protein